MYILARRVNNNLYSLEEFENKEDLFKRIQSGVSGGGFKILKEIKLDLDDNPNTIPYTPTLPYIPDLDKVDPPWTTPSTPWYPNGPWWYCYPTTTTGPDTTGGYVSMGCRINKEKEDGTVQ